MTTERRAARSRHCWLGLVGTMALALSLVACGSSGSNASGGSDSSTSTSTSSTAALSGSPIKVGSIVEVKGVGLNWAFQEAVLQAAVRGINARGGVAGHPLELHTCDGQNDPNEQLQCARDLASRGVVAIIGGISHLNGAAVDAYLSQHHISQIGIVPISAADFTSPNVFLIDSGQMGIFAGDVLNAKQHGLKKLWLMTLDVPGADVVGRVAKAAAKVARIKIVGQSRIPATAANDASYVQAALSAGADGVIPAMGAAQTSTLLLALKQAGAKLTVLNLDTEPADGLKDACGPGGGICKGALGAAGFLPPTYTKNAGIRLFQQDLKAEAADGNSAAKPASAYNTLAMPGWLGMQAFAKIAAKLPTITPESVLDGFSKATNIDLWGIIPAWTPNQSAGIAGFPRISNTAMYYTKLHSDILPYATDGKPHDVLKLVPTLKRFSY